MAVFDPFAVPISRSRPAAISAATVRSCAIFALSLAGAIVFACWLHRSYPLGDWLFFDVAKIWLFELVLSAACVTAGYAIVDRCLPAEPRDELEALVLAFPVGLVAFVMGMFAGGLLRTYGPVFALALPAVLISGGVPAGVAALRRLRGRPSGLSGANQGLLSRAMVAAGILGVGLLYLGVMSPAALNHDAAWNHLVVAQDYAREGRMVRFPGDWVKNLPHLGSVVNTWAFLVPGLREPQLRWMMALHSEFVVFLWTLAGISVLGRWLVGRRGSKAWVAFLLFPAIFIYDNNMGGAADHFVALFAAPLLLLTAKAAERFARGPCLLWGLLAGGALLSKLQAVYLLGPLAAVIAVRVVILLTRRRRWWNRGDGPAPAGGLLLMAITATAVLAPHLLLNTLWFHNPVYPLWQDLFTGSRPTVTDAPMLVDTLFAAWPWHPPEPWLERVLATLKMVVTFSFVPHYWFEHDRPRTGSLFTLALPLLFFLPRSRRLWLGAGVGLGALVCWAATYWVDRNLQTFTPVLIAVTAAILARAWTMGVLARAGVLLLVALQLVSSGDVIFAGSGRVTDAMSLIQSGAGNAKNRFTRYRSEYVALGASLPKDATIMFHNWHLTLGVDRRVLHDAIGFQGIIDYRKLDTPQALYHRLKELGVTHVAQVPNVDPGLSRKEEIVFQAFADLYRDTTRSFGGLRVFELPATPPVAREPTRALVLGLRGYANGLYPVRSLATCELLPPAKQRFAAPDAESDSPFDLLDNADAVLIGSSVQLDADDSVQLDRDFRVVAAYSALKLWLRR